MNNIIFKGLTKNNIFFIFIFTVFYSCTTDNTVQKNKISRQLDSLFTSLSQNYSFNGNILIALDGEVLYQSQFGFADFYKKEKLNKNTVFNLASIAKQFTAVAISILKEEGKLRFSDSITKYLPEIPYQNITITQLLNHTSGIPDFYDFMNKYWDKSRIATNNDILKTLINNNIKLNFQPGEKYKYSNTGYVLLALIIERISKTSYQEFMKSRIFEPAGMKNTRVKDKSFEISKLQNFAKGHIISIKHGFIFPEKYDEYSFLNYLDETVGDGNIFSNTEDLLKYDNALNSEKIVSNQTLQQIFSYGKLQNGDTIKIELKGQSYGFGWRIRNSKIGKIIWHSGHLPGISNLYIKNPDNGITIFILSNNGFESYKIYDKTFEIITGAKMETPKVFGEIALKKLLSKGSISESKQEFKLLTTNNNVLFSESQLNDIGYELVNLKRYDDAMEIFSLNTEKHPDSANAFDSLGELYLLLGKNNDALQNYQKALQIDSVYENAKVAKTIINKIKHEDK